mmetsp:Transcript_7569/g.10469  ORF Transcript_7569/g.10469 Transcript_7569/m.10469 type:complete len:207 (-) Transcript_7569:167-787(-)
MQGTRTIPTATAPAPQPPPLPGPASAPGLVPGPAPSPTVGAHQAPGALLPNALPMPGAVPPAPAPGPAPMQQQPQQVQYQTQQQVQYQHQQQRTQAQLAQPQLPQQAQQRHIANRGLDGGWQSDRYVEGRRRMIAQVVHLLRQRKRNAPQEWLNKLPQMAKRLEELLYRSAPSFDSYNDVNTLKQRLQQLAKEIVRNRKFHKAPAV